MGDFKATLSFTSEVYRAVSVLTVVVMTIKRFDDRLITAGLTMRLEMQMQIQKR